MSQSQSEMPVSSLGTQRSVGASTDVDGHSVANDTALVLGVNPSAQGCAAQIPGCAGTGLSLALDKIGTMFEENSTIDKIENQILGQNKEHQPSLAGTRNSSDKSSRHERKPEGRPDDNNKSSPPLVASSTSAFDLHPRSPARVISPEPSSRTPKSAHSRGSSKKSSDSSSKVLDSSPMARLRSGDISHEAVQGENVLKKKKQAKTPEEIKKDKQKRWKRQMRAARKRQEQERKSLDDESFTHETTKDNQESGGLFSVSNFLAGLIEGCGNVEDVSISGDESENSEEDGLSDDQSSYDNDRSRSIRSPQSSSRSEISGDLRGRIPYRGERSFAREVSRSKSREPSPFHSKAPLSPRSTECQPPDSRELDPFLENSSFYSMSEHNQDITNVLPVPNNKNFIREFISVMKTTGCKVQWHKEPDSMKAFAVSMNIKIGCRGFDGSHNGPRLTWSDIRSPLDKFGIDIFDIQFLDRADPVHLKSYPYAMPGRTILLTLTKGRDFIFEAPTEEFARIFIHGMRWVVARLIFNLVIGNLDVSCELLDVGLMPGASKGFPETTKNEEEMWTKAMDDATNQMVDRALLNRSIC